MGRGKGREEDRGREMKGAGRYKGRKEERIGERIGAERG